VVVRADRRAGRAGCRVNLRSAFRCSRSPKRSSNPPAAAANALVLCRPAAQFLLDGLIIFVGLMLTAIGAIAARVDQLDAKRRTGQAVNF